MPKRARSSNSGEQKKQAASDGSNKKSSSEPKSPRADAVGDQRPFAFCTALADYVARERRLDTQQREQYMAQLHVYVTNEDNEKLWDQVIAFPEFAKTAALYAVRTLSCPPLLTTSACLTVFSAQGFKESSDRRQPGPQVSQRAL